MTRARDTADTQDNSGGAVPPFVAGKNPVLNSAFDIWQRGTTSATTAVIYTADRWQKGSGTNYTHSRQVTGDSTNLPFIQYCLRAQRTASSTSTTAVEVGSSFESANCIPFAGKTVTMSFYARAGANFSAASSFLLSQIYTSTSTDANLFSGGFTGAATPLSANVTLTTTWQRFTVTGTIASNTTQFAPYFTYSPTGTAGANDYFDITGIQVEVGSVATPFSRNAGTIQGELAACQRYYQVFGGNNGQYPIVTGYATSAQTPRYPIAFPVTMRITPTIAKTGTWDVSNCAGPSPTFIGTYGFAMEVLVTSTGNFYAYPNSTDDTFTCSSEL